MVNLLLFPKNTKARCQWSRSDPKVALWKNSMARNFEEEKKEKKKEKKAEKKEKKEDAKEEEKEEDEKEEAFV